MRKKSKKPSKRVERAARFVDGNKVFIVMILLVVIGLIGGNFLEKKIPDAEQEQAVSEQQSYQPEWHFYWSDLIVLVGAGGFCTVKILHQKKRAKEELR